MRRRSSLSGQATPYGAGPPAALPEGKIDPELLAPLLPRAEGNGATATGVLIGAAVGEDAAVVTGAARLVLTSDPITLAGNALGRYTVAVNCNDLVAMGAEPRYLTTTILLPLGTTRDALEGMFMELAAAATAAGIAWVGGHTEVTGTVVSPVVAGAAVGVLEGEPWSSAGARPGDALVLTKWVALEGCTLLARERPDARGILGAEHAAVVRWLDDPGISVVAEGRVLRGHAIHAAHDPTEGGVAQGIHELALRSGVASRTDGGGTADQARDPAPVQRPGDRPPGPAGVGCVAVHRRSGGGARRGCGPAGGRYRRYRDRHGAGRERRDAACR